MLAAAVQLTVVGRSACAAHSNSYVSAMNAIERLQELLPIFEASSAYWPAAGGVQKVLERIKEDTHGHLMGKIHASAISTTHENDHIEPGQFDDIDLFSLVDIDSITNNQDWLQAFGLSSV